MSKVDRTDIKAQIAASVRKFSQLAKDETGRRQGVIEMPEFIQRKAALISSHFLLPAESTVVDMGCETGEVTYALALMNPRTTVIGIDRDLRAIEHARKTYKLPNLTFRQSDFSIPDVEDGSVDGIVNSNVLHLAYSAADYSQEEISQVLEAQIKKLRPGGTMLIRDYIMPPADEMVYLELPDVESHGSTPADMSDADLLVKFSHTARPLVTGCEGFFLEEHAPRREGTRLFRLHHKWALEFIHRKNYRISWEKELKHEYTFYTWQDYRREFSRLGMRMIYSAPYWNPWVVKNCFKGRFQLYTDAYEPRNWPATNYFIVGQKVEDQQSLIIEERRPSQAPVGDLKIMVVRDRKSGQLHELVKRPREYCDIIPYRRTPDGRLLIYVRDGCPRPIVNAVMRGSNNLDRKRWSGYLVEPITMDSKGFGTSIDENREMILDFVQSFAGLRARKGEDSVHVGVTYFPSPGRIDEAIEPIFVEVDNPHKTMWPVRADTEEGFREPGNIIELDATDVMRASHVGVLPDPRLEMHALELMAHYQHPLPKWIGDPLPLVPEKTVQTSDPEALLQELEATEFEKVSSAPVHLRAVKSVFVEEGKVGRTTRGLSAKDVEFIITEDGIENIAAVVLLSRNSAGKPVVAIDPKILPVPQRMGGSGAMINAPSFVLPRNLRTLADAEAFIAKKFNLPVDNVSSLGESYFTHVGVTPQRVYPFVVVEPAGSVKRHHFTYTNQTAAWRLWGFGRMSRDFIRLLSIVAMRTDYNHGMAPQKTLTTLKHKAFELSVDKEVQGLAIPSRVLGQRTPAPETAVKDAPKPDHTKQQQQIAEKVGIKLSRSYAAAINDRLKGSSTPLRVSGGEAADKLGQDVNEVRRKLRETFRPAPPER